MLRNSDESEVKMKVIKTEGLRELRVVRSRTAGECCSGCQHDVSDQLLVEGMSKANGGSVWLCELCVIDAMSRFMQVHKRERPIETPPAPPPSTSREVAIRCGTRSAPMMADF